MPLLPLPAYEVPRNALLDLEPINRTIGEYRENSERLRRQGISQRAGRLAAQNDLKGAAGELFQGGELESGTKLLGVDQQRQQFDLEHNHRRAQQLAGVMQMIQAEPDPAKRTALYVQFKAAIPDFETGLNTVLPKELHGDLDTVIKFTIARAAGYRDPLDRKLKEAKLEESAADSFMKRRHGDYFEKQGAALQQKPQGQLKEVNGKLVFVSPDAREVREVYNAGQNFDKHPEFALKSAGFTTRMVDAEENVRRLMADPSKFNPTTAGTAIKNAMPETFANWALRSPEHQQYQQAAEQWIRAFLRKESGAAISKDEFARDFKVYFPQPGDGAETIAQKERARFEVARSMSEESRGFFPHASPQHHQRLQEWSGKDQGRLTQPAPTQQRPRAVNKQTGQMIEFDGRQWVPVR